MPTTSGLGDIVILGEGAKNWGGHGRPGRPCGAGPPHSSSIPELSGNQRSPFAHRELEFAGREVKLPGVLHSFLTVIKGMPTERGVRPNLPEPPPPPPPPPPAYGPARAFVCRPSHPFKRHPYTESLLTLSVITNLVVKITMERFNWSV